MGSTQPLFQLAQSPRRGPRRGTERNPIVFIGSQMGQLAQPEQAAPSDKLNRRELSRPLKVGESIEVRFVDQLVTVTITAFQIVEGARSVCGYRVATLNNRAEPLEHGLYCRTVSGFGPVPESEARGFARWVQCQLMSAGETIRWIVTRDGVQYSKEIVASDAWR